MFLKIERCMAHLVHKKICHAEFISASDTIREKYFKFLKSKSLISVRC